MAVRNVWLRCQIIKNQNHKGQREGGDSEGGDRLWGRMPVIETVTSDINRIKIE
jgi:hypothetical protein